MKHLIALTALMVSFSAAASAPIPPIRSGQYTFQHKFAEQPDLPGTPLVAKIGGLHIVLSSKTQTDGFPKGIVAEGTLMWHAKSRQWIIGNRKSDRYAKAVGGCSDGPEVVDLQNKIYWTC